MKIAYLSTYPPEFCGIASYMKKFVHHIKNHLDDYIIISTSKGSGNNRIFQLPTPWNPTSIYKCISKINSFNPDVVHIQYTSRFFKPWLPILVRLINYPIVLSSHEVLIDDNSRMNKLKKALLLLYERSIYQCVDKIIVHNDLMKIRLTKFYGVDDTKISVTPLGVDVKLLPKTDYRLNNKLLFFGYIHHGKGIDTLLDAFTILQKKIPELELIMVGGIRSKSAREYIEKRMKRDGLNIKITEFVDEERVGEFMREGDIVIFPHHNVSHSLAVAETMAYGIPIVASRVGGFRYQIDNGKTGLLFEPNSTENLVDVVSELLNDAKKRAKLGKNARECAKKELSWKRICDKTLSVYKEAKNSCSETEKNP